MEVEKTKLENQEYDPSIEIVRFRHAAANVDEIIKKKQEDPMGPLEAEDEIGGAFSEKHALGDAGREQAKNTFEEYFSKIEDPENTRVCIVTSPRGRAYETAEFAAEAAHKRGVEIMSVDSKILAMGKLRQGHLSNNPNIYVMDKLINEVPNTLLGTMFGPPFIPEFEFQKWELVNIPDPEIKAKFIETYKSFRAKMAENNKGSWGANYAEYGEEAKKLFGELGFGDQIITAKELQKTQLQELKKEAKFARMVTKLEKNKKKTIFLVIGHENDLQSSFEEQGIGGIPNLGRVDVKFEKNGIAHAFFGDKKVDL